MRILFNSINCGLGNNGGSSTIIHSANTLVDMGHDIKVIDSMKNKFTWFPLKAKHIILKDLADCPDADVVIATGYKTVGPTLKLPDRCGIKAHWIRAWERWQMPDDQICVRVLNAPTIKLVNSLCLQRKLEQYQTPSHIVRPGYDFGKLYPLNLRSYKDKQLIIGALYREGVHGERKRTKWVLDAAKQLYTTGKIKLWMFGSEPKPNLPFLDNYLRLPSFQQKNEFYNKVHLWIAPTMSEGLHLPPAEAMMTECPVLGTDAQMSGMQDYLIEGMTGKVSGDSFMSFFHSINEMINRRNMLQRFGKNARLKIMELGDRKTNMQLMINYLKSLI